MSQLLKTLRSAGANSLAPTACSKARRSEALGNEGGLGGSPDQEARLVWPPVSQPRLGSTVEVAVRRALRHRRDRGGCVLVELVARASKTALTITLTRWPSSRDSTSSRARPERGVELRTQNPTGDEK